MNMQRHRGRGVGEAQGRAEEEDKEKKCHSCGHQKLSQTKDADDCSHPITPGLSVAVRR